MSTKIENKLLIIGCGGHAKVISDIAKSLGLSELYYLETNFKNKEFLGKEVIHKDINNFNDNFFVAIGDNYLREKITHNFKLKNPNAINKTLIHPSSVVSENCSIKNGTVVMPLCVINSGSKIGEGVIINTHASIDHDNFLMNYCSVAPGVITGGDVQIGKRSVIGIGSTVKNNIEIGSDSVIGAASYVNKNIPDSSIYYGTPAKLVKSRKASDKYL
mgnify:CR=1 FL=1